MAVSIINQLLRFCSYSHPLRGLQISARSVQFWPSYEFLKFGNFLIKKYQGGMYLNFERMWGWSPKEFSVKNGDVYKVCSSIARVILHARLRWKYVHGEYSVPFAHMQSKWKSVEGKWVKMARDGGCLLHFASFLLSQCIQVPIRGHLRRCKHRFCSSLAPRICTRQ